jgi:hypothetical protein
VGKGGPWKGRDNPKASWEKGSALKAKNRQGWMLGTIPGCPRTGFDDKALMILTNKVAIASAERSLEFIKAGILR